MRIDSSGNLDMTNGGGNIIMANGAGIDFSASEGAGATTSLLDDYEEGTWTPQIQFTSGGTVSYTRQDGAYTKIGRYVFVEISVIFDTVGASGAIQLTNFPFLPAAVAPAINDRGVLNVGYADKIDAVDMTFLVRAGEDIADSYYYAGSKKTTSVGTGQLSVGNKNLHIAGGYKTSA